MNEKNDNLTLYVLKFKDLPLIKIGTSLTVGVRIKQLEREYNETFELNESIAVGCHSVRKIKALEKELLANSEDFFHKYDKFNELD